MISSHYKQVISQKINTQLRMQTMTTQLHPKINLPIRSSSSSYWLSGYVLLLFTRQILTSFWRIHCNLARWKNSKTASIFFNLPLYQVNDGNKSWYILISSVALHFSDYNIFKSVFNSFVQQILKSVLKFYNWPSREGKYYKNWPHHKSVEASKYVIATLDTIANRSF